MQDCNLAILIDVPLIELGCWVEWLALNSAVERFKYAICIQVNKIKALRNDVHCTVCIYQLEMYLW